MMALRKSSIIGRCFISTMALVLSSIKRPHPAQGDVSHNRGLRLAASYFAAPVVGQISQRKRKAPAPVSLLQVPR